MKREVENIILFKENEIRRIWHNNEWVFSVVDVIGILSKSDNPRNYWKVLKHRLKQEESEVVTKCNQLKLVASDGKYRESDCANTKNILRIIQSIPSKRAEPFKLWLAKVGSERIDEIENPELAQNRAKEYYEKKGHSKDWIEKRLRSIGVRQKLTDEWKNRNVNEGTEYAILTNEIAKATFGVSIAEHKQIKSLSPQNKNENLRDHMTDLELIFTMLGEASTTEITINKNTQGFPENLDAAQKGGNISGEAREKLEKESGKKIVSNSNDNNLIKISNNNNKKGWLLSSNK
jgi:DNA-damage-inducible protein D